MMSDQVIPVFDPGGGGEAESPLLTLEPIKRRVHLYIQWNLSIKDTLGP